MDEQRRLLMKPNSSSHDSSDEEEWTDEYSSESYYSDDTDSSVPEWESSIDESTGELLFIDSHPFVTQNNVDNKPKESSEPFSKNQTRKSTRGKFLRLIRRRDSKRYSRKYQRNQDNNESSSKVKFQDFQQGEEKEVLLKINTEIRKFNTNLAETLLGVSISTLSDGNRVMIAGILPDSPAKYEKNIKIGDWLKSVNNIEVNYQNLNDVLQRLARNEVLLKLQRVAGVDVTKDPPINELNNQSKFVREFINSNRDDDIQLIEILCKYCIGIIYLDTSKLNENSSEYDDLIYCYPKISSILCNIRGIFITLNHLINDITKTYPKVSSFIHKTNLNHVVQTRFNKKLLLLLLPDICVNIKEILFINKQIIQMLEFMFESLDNCFHNKKNKKFLDNFFDRFFIRLLNDGWTTIEDFIDLNKRNNLILKVRPINFEKYISVASKLHIPDEALSQIDEALTELEASDYREWNEDPLDCQRLFTILGSAYYHFGYLLSSHLVYEDLIDVHIFCDQQGLFHLSKTEPIKTLVLWRECFPKSCRQLSSLSNDNSIETFKDRYYLLVVGTGKDLLAVIMEAGGCTEEPDDNMGPDAFYVEEVQATLAHIRELGLSELIDRWLLMNPGNQITIPESNKRKNDFFNLTKPTKINEVTSILKRRNSDQTLTHSNSIFSLDDIHSDSNSEFSDRRNDDDDDDDVVSDEEISNNSFDINELRQNLLSETVDVQPLQITIGNENVLFHYLNLDETEGILLCPPDSRINSKTLEIILNNFRKCCHKIHELFGNTLRFKNMPAQDMAKSVMNKSLIAIKEYGIMFECPFLDDQDRKNKIKYWVVGRLFYMPHAREIYVCYQDTIPQNIIELAFKIDLSTLI